MMNAFASQTGFLAVLSLFAIGAVGSLLGRHRDAFANWWSGLWAAAGSLAGMAFAVAAMASEHDLSFYIGSSPFPLFSIAFHIDALAAFFIFTISLIGFFSSVYGIGYVKHYYKKYSIGALGFFYHLFIGGMLLVVSASNAIFFLVAWEIMSIASYVLVVYDRRDENNVRAGSLYLAMTSAATAFIILAFLLAYAHAGSFDFAAIKAAAAVMPVWVKTAMFVFLMIGFGTKAGIIPFHIWLPGAHPAAPSHVSALMSGVMIKTGIYMMIRMFADVLQPVPAWWGLTILIVGAVSSLLGVLYALTEHDIKRLLAYHSIENIGIILLGLGSALAFSSLGMNSLAALGLTAALFHTLNHATFKSLLFLSAGSVINGTHTRNMEEYGGLIKRMPQTAFFFLVGAMAISALPPFNGFFSEWMTFQALFQGMMSSDYLIRWTFLVAAGALAFTGGLALACFVKAFGATFLARPRSAEATHAKESPWSMRAAMGGLSALLLVIGLASGWMIPMLDRVAHHLMNLESAPPFVVASPMGGISSGNGFAAVSAPAFFVLAAIILFLTVVGIKFLVYRKQKTVIGATWDCGTNLTPRMEITATGFARSIILIFKGVLRPTIQRDITYRDAESRYLPQSRTISLGNRDVYQSYFYQPLQKVIRGLSVRTTNIQSGNINAYISYIFAALVLALFIAL